MIVIGRPYQYQRLALEKLLKAVQMRQEEIMRNVVSRAQGVLLITVAACLTVSCSKHEPLQAANIQPADIPTVPVARITTEDLSRGLVLTAEFKPFQEIDVMA